MRFVMSVVPVSLWRGSWTTRAKRCPLSTSSTAIRRDGAVFPPDPMHAHALCVTDREAEPHVPAALQNVDKLHGALAWEALHAADAAHAGRENPWIEQAVRDSGLGERSWSRGLRGRHSTTTSSDLVCPLGRRHFNRLDRIVCVSFSRELRRIRRRRLVDSSRGGPRGASRTGTVSRAWRLRRRRLDLLPGIGTRRAGSGRLSGYARYRGSRQHKPQLAGLACCHRAEDQHERPCDAVDTEARLKGMSRGMDSDDRLRPRLDLEPQCGLSRRFASVAGNPLGQHDASSP